VWGETDRDPGEAGRDPGEAGRAPARGRHVLWPLSGETWWCGRRVPTQTCIGSAPSVGAEDSRVPRLLRSGSAPAAREWECRGCSGVGVPRLLRSGSAAAEWRWWTERRRRRRAVIGRGRPARRHGRPPSSLLLPAHRRLCNRQRDSVTCVALHVTCPVIPVPECVALHMTCPVIPVPERVALHMTCPVIPVPERALVKLPVYRLVVFQRGVARAAGHLCFWCLEK